MGLTAVMLQSNQVFGQEDEGEEESQDTETDDDNNVDDDEGNILF